MTEMVRSGEPSIDLPFHTGIIEIDQDRVIDAVLSFQGE
jgi:hypothetical protein